MKKLKYLASAMALLAMSSAVAMAAGLYTNGLPVAGGTQYPSTLPLTGNETVPADTNLTQGLNPATEGITVGQLAAFSQVPGTLVTATNTASFTATTAQVLPAAMAKPSVFLALTGTLSAAGTITTPTAAAIVAALPAIGGAVGQSYVLKIANESSGVFAWTLTGGTGVTVNGSGLIPQNGSRNFLVNFTSTTAVTITDLGN